jgi:iron complex outermembrane recepter protein
VHKIKPKSIVLAGSLFTVSGGIGWYPAIAADAAASDDTQSGVQGSQLVEIVVTAQRRAERLQDVPISVSAITGADLQSQSLRSTLDLSAVVPGLDVTINGSSGILYIRGVGQNDGSPNAEAAVATYVDGVYIASSIANLPRFNDVDRIEVLKGPQGTLFGRNATAGVIQIITRDPSDTPSVEVSGGYGNYGTSTASLYMTGGIAQGLAADLSAVFDNQQDGYGHNLFNGQDAYVNAEDSIALRSKLLFNAGDNTQIRVSADYDRTRSTGAEYSLAAGSKGVNGQTSPVYGDYNVDINQPPSNSMTQYGASIRVTHDFDMARLESISAYRDSTSVLFGDFDSTPLNIVNFNLNQRVSNYSQEIHLLSPAGSRVDWLLGAFYFNSASGYLPQTTSGAAVAPLTSSNLFATQKVNSGSIFGQATAEILPKTKLTLGLRGTAESVRLINSFEESAGTTLAAYAPQSLSTSRLTWRVALDHNFTTDVMGYLSYNRGLKTGGFSILTPNAPGFKPEVLDAYETGLKSEWLDRRLRINLAAYFYKDKDIQVNQLSNEYGTVTQNAAAGTIKGIDLEVKVVPIRGLTITSAAGYLNSRYDQYDNAIGYGPNAFTESVIDATGKELINAPKFTGSITAEYSAKTSIGELKPQLTVIRNSGYYVGADNRLEQPAYTRLNANLGWTSPNQRFGVSLWGANLTNALYYLSRMETVFGDIQEPAAPRTFGVLLNAKF